MSMKCRICGSSEIAMECEAEELMIPTHEKFKYFECKNCHCLQIKDIPEDLGKFYGSDYYSYNNHEYDNTETPITDMSPILDVGCGSGRFLLELRNRGYGNLCGCDPFFEKDVVYPNGVKIYKRSIHEMDGKYSMVFFNDSFEHVTDPHEVLDSLHKILADDGMAKICIPVYPNIAFEMYGSFWYQLDAPRHIFLHSKDSMRYLAEQHGFNIVNTVYDSSNAQIFRSYLYSKGIPYWQQDLSMIYKEWSEPDINQANELVTKANAVEYGDHAAFFLMKK